MGGENPINQNQLAVIRTALANERTFLAYLRTALTLLIAGISFVEFFRTGGMQLLGWFFCACGAVIFAFGVVRFRQMRKALKP